MQRQEIFFCRSQEQFWIKLSFGIAHPPAIHQMQCICVGESSRVPNLQTEFNYLDLFKSNGIFSDFVVPMWSPSSPRCPHSPRRSPCGLNGLWSPWSPHVIPMVPHCPHHPDVVPVIPTSSKRSPHHPQPPPRHPLHPPPSPWGWGPIIIKNAIRFEIIKIF